MGGASGRNFSMFGLNLKLVLGLAVLAVIGGLITLQHFTVKRLNAATARANQAEANYTALQEAQKHERKIAKESDERFTSRIAELEAERVDKPFPAVRLRQCPAATVSPSTGATGLGHAEAEGHDQRTPTADRDIGPDLERFASDCQFNMELALELQNWIGSR
jgi:hypothetical protein